MWVINKKNTKKGEVILQIPSSLCLTQHQEDTNTDKMVQILYFVFTFEINGSDSVFCIGVISFLIKAKTAAL
jgi:hypothetical protein